MEKTDALRACLAARLSNPIRLECARYRQCMGADIRRSTGSPRPLCLVREDELHSRIFCFEHSGTYARRREDQSNDCFRIFAFATSNHLARLSEGKTHHFKYLVVIQSLSGCREAGREVQPHFFFAESRRNEKLG